MTDATGGQVPITTEEFAERAKLYVLNPSRNPLKAFFDRFSSVEETPPTLGIFNNVPWHKVREDEIHAWARAGLSWVVNDGEHCQWEGVYSRDANAALLRHGITPVQRLHREALSSHGDVLSMGARATMRPYGITFEDAVEYFQCVNFPTVGASTRNDRGAFPMRRGDRTMTFSVPSLREAEAHTQGWLQFETEQWILDHHLRDRVLDVMARQPRNRAVAFVGPFDAVMRTGNIPNLEDEINSLFRAATARGVHSSRVVGSSIVSDPKDIQATMQTAIRNGCRLIALHYFTSDMPLFGALNLSQPFWNACQAEGFAVNRKSSAL
eukprot:TRINITY_DN21132_c0_g1_i1.p1 TRINITY_DN21132_c0_g1~~TRINITY_DN21132_c0_g1_i1.p1  ORF type:complete len:331 (-),score=31.20 TRINITY_DN21132_c0_g1_i1:39-1010(-)